MPFDIFSFRLVLDIKNEMSIYDGQNKIRARSFEKRNSAFSGRFRITILQLNLEFSKQISIMFEFNVFVRMKSIHFFESFMYQECITQHLKTISGNIEFANLV